MTDIKMIKCEICGCKDEQGNFEKRKDKPMYAACWKEFDRQVASNEWSKRYTKIMNLIDGD